MNNKQMWQVRKKHIIVWGIIILVIIGSVGYKSFGTKSIFEIVRSGIEAAFWMLWFCPPLSVTIARDGSKVSNFARGILGDGGIGFGGKNIFHKDVYNLNNAFDGMLFGLQIFVIMFQTIVLLFRVGWFSIKYFICYLIVAVPFPFETYYCYLKSRDEIKKINVIVPIISFLVISIFIGVSSFATIKADREARRVAAENEFKAAGKVRISVDEIANYEGIYFVVTENETADVRKGAGNNYEVIQKVNVGETYVGTSRADKEEDVEMWYEIYLNDEKTETGWIRSSAVKQEKQEKFDIQLSVKGNTSGIFTMVGGDVVRKLEKGEKLIGTGNLYSYEEGSSSFWFEVYANAEMTEKAWISARFVGARIYVVDKEQ